MIEERRTLKVRPRRVAAPARVESDDEAARRGRGLEPEIHLVCDLWGQWCETRRYFAPPSNLQSTLGRLGKRIRSTAGAGGPNAALDPQLYAFNCAVNVQPTQTHAEARAVLVFKLHFIARPKPIKIVAQKLGIDRAYWHVLVAKVARHAWAAHHEILRENVLTLKSTKYFATEVNTLAQNSPSLK